MPRFAANLTMMFNETGFLDRFAAAAAVGFKAVEFLFPYEFEPDVIRQRLETCGLTQALFNLPPGNWAAGERGLAALAGRRRIPPIRRDGLRYAGAAWRRTVAREGLADRSDAKSRDTYRASLALACDRPGGGLDVPSSRSIRMTCRILFSTISILLRTSSPILVTPI
jgi:hydroxypyruvate isomerase